MNLAENVICEMNLAENVICEMNLAENVICEMNLAENVRLAQVAVANMDLCIRRHQKEESMEIRSLQQQVLAYKCALDAQAETVRFLSNQCSISPTYHQLKAKLDIVTSERNMLYQANMARLGCSEMELHYRKIVDDLAARLSHWEGATSCQQSMRYTMEHWKLVDMAQQNRLLARKAASLQRHNTELVASKVYWTVAQSSCAVLEAQCISIDAMLTRLATCRFGDDLHTRAAMRASRVSDEMEKMCNVVERNLGSLCNVVSKQTLAARNMERRISTMRAMLSARDGELRRARARIAELEHKVKEMEELDRSADDLYRRVAGEAEMLIAASRGAALEASGARRDLAGVVASIQEERAKIEGELSSARTLKSREREVSDLRACTARLKAQNAELARSTARSAELSRKQAADNAAARARNDELARSVTKLQGELQATTRDRDNNGKRISNLQKQISELQRNMNRRMEEELATLAARLQGRETEVAFLSCENAALRQTNGNISSQLAEARFSVCKLKSELENVTPCSELRMHQLEEELLNTKVDLQVLIKFIQILARLTLNTKVDLQATRERLRDHTSRLSQICVSSLSMKLRVEGLAKSLVRDLADVTISMYEADGALVEVDFKNLFEGSGIVAKTNAILRASLDKVRADYKALTMENRTLLEEAGRLRILLASPDRLWDEYQACREKIRTLEETNRISRDKNRRMENEHERLKALIHVSSMLNKSTVLHDQIDEDSNP